MIGATVSHYRILERLGGGGMGVVYLAHDTKLDRQVALKFLPIEWSRDVELRERFLREARATSALDHPHICTIYEIDESPQGQLFIAMTYCPGETLKERIKAGPLSTDEAVTFAIQIAEALESAHENGVVHRDIKPANILITGRDQVKVVDFGLAKLAGEAAVTRDGAVIGTPAYMSPEQAKGEEVDGRSDLWALGVVLYEMLTGRRAFAADHERAVLLAITTRDPTPVDTLRSDVPAELLRILRRCLKRDPNRRYQSAAELLADLRRFRGESTPAETVTQTLPSVPSVRRKRLLVHRALPIAAAVLAVLVAAQLYRVVERSHTRHLLVLPFNCVGGEPQLSRLCAGLLDTVTTKLGELQRFRSDLSVVPATEVRSRGVASAGEAHTIFGVDLVVAGSIQHDGGTVRIPLQLVDAEHLRELRSKVLTTELAADFVLQDRIVEVLEQMLDLELEPAERQALMAGGTRNAEAAQLYLEASGYILDSSGEAELGEAISLYREALSIDPMYLDAMVQLADVCLRRSALSNDPIWIEHGVAYAHRALNIDPDLPAVQLAAGRLELARKAYPAAIDHLARTIELDPLELLAYTNLAVAYRETGADDRAKEVLVRAERTGPDDWRTYQRIGAFFFERNDWQTAAGYFRRVIELLPEASVGYTSLGGTLLYLGQRDEARTNLERAVAIGCGYIGYSNLATLEFFEGNCSKAATLYNQALEIRDSDYRTWNNLAEALLCADDPQRARAAFAQAAELVESQLAADPDDLELLVDLASFKVHLGDEAGAREAVARALTVGITNSQQMVALAAVYEALDERDQALAWIERALEDAYPLEVIADYPGFAELVKDPRFARLAAQYGAQHAPPAEETPEGEEKQ